MSRSLPSESFLTSASNPSKAERGSSVRPAIDNVNVYRCCCYPAIQMAERDWPTGIPEQVLLELRQEISTSVCHLATAAPPGEEGRFLRVSTTFLERKLMRSLSTVQGQLFILLKYLIKKIIANRVVGLKTYHAKTLLFYMMEEMPPDEWKPESLLHLTRRAMQKLHSSMLNESALANECMKHFFLRDAVVYLKKGGSDKAAIAEAIATTIAELPQIAVQFIAQLESLVDSHPFYFHPFLIIPDLWQVLPVSGLIGTVEYHEIYDMVRIIMERLVSSADDVSLQSLEADIDRLPDCAYTVRECLRVMALLKFDAHHEAASSVLRRSIDHVVSRSIPVPVGMTADDTIPAVVWNHLNSSDSNWKFYFNFPTPPQFRFLSENLQHIFPIAMRNYVTYFLANFDVLKKALCLELLLIDEVDARIWFEEILQDEDADVAEISMVMHYCDSIDLLVRLIHGHAQLLSSENTLQAKLEELLKLNPNLKEEASLRTLSELKLEFDFF